MLGVSVERPQRTIQTKRKTRVCVAYRRHCLMKQSLFVTAFLSIVIASFGVNAFHLKPWIHAGRGVFSTSPSKASHGTSFSADVLFMHGWEGDDLRWSTKLRRRLRRRRMGGSDEDTPAKTTLMVVNSLLFFYQVITTVNFIIQRHPSYWPSHAISIIADALVGSSVNGPLTADFAFSNALSQVQPHRYLTSGFFHSSIFHLLLNLDTLRRQPSWLETGLGAPLYLTTFFVSIVTGNLGYLLGINDPFDRSICLGLSGGLAGLYGLMYCSLVKMGNPSAAGRIIRGMGILFLSGVFIDNVSSLAHIGGFLGGVGTAILFSPSYKKNYGLRRKNSAEYDQASRDFRQVMGFGVMPSERGILPLPLLWGALAIAFAVSKPKFRAMPALALQGFLFPGTVIG